MAKRRGQGEGSTAKAEFKVWVNLKTRRIHIASEEAGVISTISEKPAKPGKTALRYHPHLYRNLRAFLQREGCWPDDL